MTTQAPPPAPAAAPLPEDGGEFAARTPPGMAEGFRVQRRVIGALLLRELHIRFGRRNFGYLWLFGEPLLLGTAVASIHVVQDGGTGHLGALSVFAFFAIGYSLYYLFRAVAGRSVNGLAGSRPLLYHRIITPFDMICARHVLEGAACVGVIALTAFGVAVFEDLAPEEPLKMLGAVLLMLWLSHGLALVIAGAAERWHLAERLVHPMIYLSLPVSGAFFLVDWLPAPLQELALYNPTVHLFELMRDGQFGDRIRTRYDVTYVVECCAAVQLAGLCALRAVRPYMEHE